MDRPQPRFARCRGAVAALALALGAAAAAAGDSLTVAVSRSSLSLPIYVAEAQGFFAAEGVVVRTRECLGGHRCIKQMLDGEVSLATSSEMPVMHNAFERDDFAVIATFVTSKRDVKIVARRSAGIATAADLVGKRVATMGGTSAHYFLDLFLLFHGIDPKSVPLERLAPEQLVAALEERRVDALATFEPFAFRAGRALGADAVVLPSVRIYTETFNLSALRSLIAARHPDLVRVLRALARAQGFIREQPQAARTILAQRMQEDPTYVEATWADFDFRLSLDQPLVSTLEGQARWALREGHVPRTRRTPNFLHFVAPGPLRGADPSAVTIVQ